MASRKRKDKTESSGKRLKGNAVASGLFVVDTHRAAILLCTASIVLLSLIFAPISIWPISFFCLVPWLVLVGGAKQAPRVYFYSYMLGLVFFLVNMRWLYHATGLGYFALSVYQAAYFPAVACPVRSVVRRRRWPLAIVFPFVWVGSEMVRAVVISGFPWFYLSHSLYKVLPLIQISDLVGAYGVTFVIASVNGALADIALVHIAKKHKPCVPLGPRRLRLAIAFPVVILMATLVYGIFSLQSDTMKPGPKVAVLQGDFLDTVNGPEVSGADKKRMYLEMVDAASTQKPDLFLLPESPWRMFLNKEARGLNRVSRESFSDLSLRAIRNKSYLVTGCASLEHDASDLLAKNRPYNSAAVFYPDGREPGRYDKVHVVYFGETVPFRFSRFHSLYLWLNGLMPFSGPDGDYEYSLFAGSEFRVFDMQPASQPGTTYHFGTPICYEDVMPYVSRRFVADGSKVKRADFLLNISNDGWFGRGIQQAQHLAICVFRAVENRVGIARAVNTGISGFIDPDGKLHNLVEGDDTGHWPRSAGFEVAQLKVDSRFSAYSRYGDWFAWLCAMVWLFMFVDYWVVRVKANRAEDRARALS